MRKLLFFYAPWCSPCKFFEKEFIRPVAQRVDKCQITAVNAQESPFLADKYGVNRLPTAILLEEEKIAFYAGLPDIEKTVSFLTGR